MRRLQHFLSIIMPVLMFQTCVMAGVCDLFIKNDLYKSQYLLSYNVLDRNFISCDIAAAIFESDNFFIAGIVDKDFSLENDIDIESKKRLRPKADVLNGFKVEEDNSSKCVEKVITPKMKHRRIKNSEIAVDEENIDIDKVNDIKALKKAHKKPKVAKADKPERISWFGKLFGKKSKTEVVAMQGGNKDITDIDQPEPVKHEVKEELSKNQDIDAIADIDRVAEVKPVKPERQPKPEKIKPEKPVKVAEVKPVKPVEPERQPKPAKIKPEKPVKVAEVKPERPPKPAKIKPEKPVKVAEVKPVRQPKPEKIKPEKPVKVAEVKPERQSKPEKIKPEKPVKVAEVKPVRQPKPEKIKPEKPVKVAEVKPVRQPKPEKIKPEKPVKVVSRTTSDATAACSSQQGVYNYPAAQEVPVSSSFEMFQSRLPLTRKPFDDEECMYR